MEKLNLEKEWNTLCEDSSISVGQAKAVFDDVCSAYSQSHRYYHTLQHVEHMLSLLKEANIESPSVSWATWLHDYVYEPGASDNELLSAQYAETAMRQLCVSTSVIEQTKAMILATKTHQCDVGSPEMQILLDADMAILGAEPERYQDYCGAVAKEFQSIPGFLYRRGRKKFLGGVLAQDVIYSSEWFCRRFEVQARENICTELERKL